MGRAIIVALIFLSALWATSESHAASLWGGKAAMAEENAAADRDNLSRIQNNAELQKMKDKAYLMPLPQNDTITIDPRLPEQLRWCRYWTREFLLDVGEAFYKKFKHPLQINSAVRTADHQLNLSRAGNHNAAPSSGPLTSTHLTGATIDIGKLPMSEDEIEWMRKELLQLEDRGLIDATEEYNQMVFHIMVHKSYSTEKQEP